MLLNVKLFNIQHQLISKLQQALQNKQTKKSSKKQYQCNKVPSPTKWFHWLEVGVLYDARYRIMLFALKFRGSRNHDVYR